MPAKAYECSTDLLYRDKSKTDSVIPAKAGIHVKSWWAIIKMDPRLRGDDVGNSVFKSYRRGVRVVEGDRLESWHTTRGKL